MSRIFSNDRIDRQIKRIDEIISNPDDYTKDELIDQLTRQKKYMEAARKNEEKRNQLMTDLNHLNMLNEFAFKGFATMASSHEMAGILSGLNYSVKQIENSSLRHSFDKKINRLESIFIGFKEMSNKGYQPFKLDHIKKVVENSQHPHHDIIIDNSCSQLDNEDVYTYHLIANTMLYNLISNGIYFSREHLRDNNINERPKVHIHYHDKALYVSDSGAGLTEEAERNLFHYGYTTRVNGNGFGLTLCKEYTKQRSMDIEYMPESEFNILGGACFKISL